MRTFLLILVFTSSHAFVPLKKTNSCTRPSPCSTSTVTSTCCPTTLQALWHQWVPISQNEPFDGLLQGSHDEILSNEEDNTVKGDHHHHSYRHSSQTSQRKTASISTLHRLRDKEEEVEMNAYNFFLTALLAFLFVVIGGPVTGAYAVSGGGLDYAGLDITGQDFSSNNYKGKDFTQVIAKGTNFAKSNLQGCRFYKSYLVNADFHGADISGASLEDTSMDGANLKDAIAKGSYFSKSILDVATVENADFTDAQFPPKVTPLLCEREDMKGTNPKTGADTRESAMCL